MKKAKDTSITEIKVSWVAVTLNICSEQKEPGELGLLNDGLLRRLVELLPGETDGGERGWRLRLCSITLLS